MNKNIFYITFGSGHLFGLGLKYYLKIYAPNELTARLWMNKKSEARWSGIYTEKPNHGEKCLGVIVIRSENIDEWASEFPSSTD